jgi:NAD(P)H-dependent FMN reductase
MQILAISGSLRRISSKHNAASRCRHLGASGHCGHVVRRSGGPARVKSDLDGSEPSSVVDFRAQLNASDAVLISSPNMPTVFRGRSRTHLIGSSAAVNWSTNRWPY